MNKKLSLAIVAGGIIFIVAALNTILNTQKNSCASLKLNNIESLANESECNCDDENDDIFLLGFRC
jgi:peptidoglycan hydrolase CwlO-like protein